MALPPRIHSRANTKRRRRAFTLVEILISIAIIAVLISLLLPAMSGTMGSARAFKCQVAQRAVMFDLQLFAEGEVPRGDDASLAGDRFRLETFQESQYGIDEFWAWPGRGTVSLPDEAGNDPLRCAAIRGEVALRSGVPCSRGAISPPDAVSYGFNIRLHIAEDTRGGGPAARPVLLSPRIVDQSSVPILWDVDGGLAREKGVSPVFSGPSLDSEAVFAGDRYWFPGSRHGRAANFAFLDGRVESSRNPLHEGWDWDYSPAR